MPHLAPELLSMLRCPVTGSALSQDGNQLRAAEPGPDGQPVTYHIDEGIAVLLPADLLTAASRAGSDQHDGPSITDSTTKQEHP